MAHHLLPTGHRQEDVARRVDIDMRARKVLALAGDDQIGGRQMGNDGDGILRVEQRTVIVFGRRRPHVPGFGDRSRKNDEARERVSKNGHDVNP